MRRSTSNPNRLDAGWRTATAAVGLLLLIPLIAAACNVPVFRFALERWRADAYRVTLLHGEPLTPAQQELLTSLRQRIDASPSNLQIEVVESTVGSAESGTNDQSTSIPSSAPQLVVRYPAPLRIEQPVWSGPFEQAAIESLLESPVRSELIRRLVDGQTAVYVLLEGESAADNETVAARVEAKLKKLEEELKLPELTDSADDELRTTKPLKIAFSQLRVRRDDPSEQALVGTLVRAESDLFERNDPMVFPVFGRGRALLPLVGPGITDDNIHESAGFLVGACSCEIKELNPGFDLLLTADWDRLIFGDSPPPTPLDGLGGNEPAKAEFVPIPSGSSKSAGGGASVEGTSTAAQSANGDPGGPPSTDEPTEGTRSADGELLATAPAGGSPASSSPSVNLTRSIPATRYVLLAIVAVLGLGVLMAGYALGRGRGVE